MNLKGFACGFLVVTAVVASAIYGASASLTNANANPVINKPLLASELFTPDTSVVPLPTAPNTKVGADMVGFYGQTLMSAPNAEKRMELIRALGTTGTANRNNGVGLREPQAVEILDAQFGRESNPRVRIEIVNALVGFNVPEAAELLNRALDDGDPAVRQAAQQAKELRRIRQFFATCCE